MLSIDHHKIDKDSIRTIKKWFLNYAKNFRCKEDHCRDAIDLKLKHSFRVCKEILCIGSELNLNEADFYSAEVIALLHDLGRFEQYNKYRTFIDRVSIDHAELAVEIIKVNDILNGMDRFYKDLIFKAILYHNRRTLPNEEIKENLFFSKLLRDADKLDIWQVILKNNVAGYGLGDGFPNTPGISEAVYSDLVHNRASDFDKVCNLNDLTLLRIGWIYDINFTPTFRIIRERGYLKRLQATLPESSVRIKKVCSKVEAYLDEKINCSNPAA